jgi:hypothetical protein
LALLDSTADLTTPEDTHRSQNRATPNKEPKRIVRGELKGTPGGALILAFLGSCEDEEFRRACGAQEGSMAQTPAIERRRGEAASGGGGGRAELAVEARGGGSTHGKERAEKAFSLGWERRLDIV